ncbi:MAG: M2 family metallopeptidase [Pirellulales bacterium]
MNFRCCLNLTVGLSMLAMTNLSAPSAAAADAPAIGNPDQVASEFVSQHESQVRPLEIALNLAWWKANTTGKDDDFAAKVEAENKYDEALSNRDRFARLKAIHEAAIEDPILSRQIDVLYRAYLEKQLDPELLKRITSKANEIEQAFNVYRAKRDGKEITDSEARRVLKESKDSAERQAVWESSKGVGAVVAEDLRQLVLLRNEAATRLGFKDFHAMRLFLAEQDQAQVLKLFDQLDELTREPFARAKAEIDVALAAYCGIPVDELQPWHYQDPFFQEAPSVSDVSLDKVFANADIQAICRKFYDGIGLPIDDVLSRSSLYEQPGKSPHAFCTDIDREGDVRVLANIVPNEYWMGTMLHELGHSVYSSKNIPRSLPYIVRTDAHILCTEGVAMMFERFSKSGQWLEAMGVPVTDAKAYSAAGAEMRRNQLLIFSRWCQVMLRFEQQMYANPGQDLNALWWQLVEKYQLIKRPEGRSAPDYAAKIHVVSAPCYYHNYMMGQLFACQVHATIARDVLGASDIPNAFYTDDKRVGEYMKTKVFAPGATLSWNKLTRHATGEELNAKAFAAEFSAE